MEYIKLSINLYNSGKENAGEGFFRQRIFQAQVQATG